jgi:hypothetical protein
MATKERDHKPVDIPHPSFPPLLRYKSILTDAPKER